VLTIFEWGGYPLRKQKKHFVKKGGGKRSSKNRVPEGPRGEGPDEGPRKKGGVNMGYAGDTPAENSRTEDILMKRKKEQGVTEELVLSGRDKNLGKNERMTTGGPNEGALALWGKGSVEGGWCPRRDRGGRKDGGEVNRLA